MQIAIASWAANVQLLQLGGRAIEGALVLQALDLDSQAPAYVDFRKRFVERFGNPPSQAAVFSYDATMMGAEGLRRKTDSQSLRDVLRAPGTLAGPAAARGARPLRRQRQPLPPQRGAPGPLRDAAL